MKHGYDSRSGEFGQGICEHHLRGAMMQDSSTSLVLLMESVTPDSKITSTPIGTTLGYGECRSIIN